MICTTHHITRGCTSCLPGVAEVISDDDIVAGLKQEKHRVATDICKQQNQRTRRGGGEGDRDEYNTTEKRETGTQASRKMLC